MNFTWSYLVCKENLMSGSLSNWIAEIIGHFWPLVGQWSIVGYDTKSFFQLIGSMTWNFLCYLVVFNLSVFFTGIWTSIRPCRLWTWRTKTSRIKLFGANTVFIRFKNFEQFKQKLKNASENYFGGLRSLVSLFLFIWTKIIFERPCFTI